MNGFGIATAFKVEDSIVRPTVFVVSDQAAFGVG